MNSGTWKLIGYLVVIGVIFFSGFLVGGGFATGLAEREYECAEEELEESEEQEDEADESAE